MLLKPNYDKLIDANLLFCLVIKWEGREYRFSTLPINITKNDGKELFFDGGMSVPEWSEKSNLLGFDPEANSIPIELVFDDIDMAKTRMKGRSLEFSDAELSYVLEKKGSVFLTWEKRTVIFSGKITNPLVGDPSYPAGYVNFSIEQGASVSGQPLLTDASTITKSAFSTARNSSLGKRVPFVFGVPGEGIPSGAGINYGEHREFATPGYLSGASTELIIASHLVNASQVTVEDEDGNFAVLTTARSNDAIGNPYTKVDISGSGLNTSDGSASEYWVMWFASNGGGFKNPFGSEFPSPSAELTGAGDLLRFCLLKVDGKIDWQAWDSVAPFLNKYKFAGYLNENVDCLEWLENNILPFLPLEIRAGPRGLTPILSMIYASNIQRPALIVDDSPEFYVSSGIKQDGDASNIANWIVFKFAKIGKSNKLSAQLEIDPRVGGAAYSELKFSTIFSEISKNRYGLRQAEVECPFVCELATAARIAADLARSKGLPILTLDIQSAQKFGYLMLGDLIRLSSERLGLNNHLCQILNKSYTGSGFNFTLALEENPVINSRLF